MIFETHAHPDHPLIDDKDNYIDSMRSAEIDRIVIAPITYESNFTSMEYFPIEKYPEVFFAKGLHPKYAMNCPLWNKSQLVPFCDLLKNPRVVAIKTGLDFCKKKIQMQQVQKQYDFLKLFMQLAVQYDKSLVLHIRESAYEAVEFFTKNPIQTSTEIHCFTYNKKMMHEFINVGVGFFGIGGMITRTENEELREAVKEMPIEMILLESDSPFVKVEGDLGTINTSSQSLPVIAAKIAELKGITVDEIIDITYRNANRFFGLDS